MICNSRIKQVLLIFVLFYQCGPAFLPEPTKEKVTRGDLVGSWEYFADYQKTKIVLDLKLDGTFVQTIERSGNPKLQFQKGKWKINGSDLIIKVLKPVHDGSDEPWFLDWARWWIMDSRQKGLKFGIIGAADDRDPDNCFEFKKIR